MPVKSNTLGVDECQRFAAIFSKLEIQSPVLKSIVEISRMIRSFKYDRNEAVHSTYKTDRDKNELYEISIVYVLRLDYLQKFERGKFEVGIS